MSKCYRPMYCCALRMKAGELEGVRQLAPDVANRVLPRFIVPPKTERTEAEPLLIEMADMPDIGGALSASWRGRPAFIDVTYIIDEYGRKRIANWLPNMFERAWTAGVIAIPAAQLSDLREVELPAFRGSVPNQSSLKFAICVASDDLVGIELRATILDVLKSLELNAADCAVIADFAGTDLSIPKVVAPIISGALETLQEIGPWQHIIFQGTHFPEENPAKDGTAEIWPRNEWLAWREAVRFDPTTAEYMIFGDYAADCSKMSFGGGGAQAIRHVRYTTPSSWRIQRAAREGRDAQRMHGVYRAIVESGDFAGEGFSSADTFIAQGAQSVAAPPGNSTTWRQINTTHHITQVVHDIARVRGIEIKKAPAAKEMQLTLID